MRKKGELPDRVYLVIENAIDEITDIFLEGKDDNMDFLRDLRSFSFVGREFKMALREKERELIHERMKKAKTSKDRDKDK